MIMVTPARVMHSKTFVWIDDQIGYWLGTSDSLTREANQLQLPTARTTTRHAGVNMCGWSVFTDGGTHTVDGGTTDAWRGVARSLRGVWYVTFKPVVTSEAHMAFFLQEQVNKLRHH